MKNDEENFGSLAMAMKGFLFLLEFYFHWKCRKIDEYLNLIYFNLVKRKFNDFNL